MTEPSEETPVQNSGIPQPHGGRIMPWQPGESGNPKGRPRNAGLSVEELINQFDDAGLTEEELRAIAKDRKQPWRQRTAANRMLRTMEISDLADFAPYVMGDKTLEQIREEGVNTELIKRLRTTKRTGGIGNETWEEIRREVELHDRSGEDFDRVCNRTNGSPKQSVQHSGDIIHHLKRVVLDDRSPN